MIGQGNKSAYEIIREKVDANEIDPDLSLLAVLPDCPHIGKSLKASFANWWLKLGNDRGNISLSNQKNQS